MKKLFLCFFTLISALSNIPHAYSQGLNSNDLISFLSLRRLSDIQDLLAQKGIVLKDTQASTSAKYGTRYNFEYPKTVSLEENKAIALNIFVSVVLDSTDEKSAYSYYSTNDTENYTEIVKNFRRNGFTSIRTYKGELYDNIKQRLISIYRNPAGTEIEVEVSVYTIN